MSFINPPVKMPWLLRFVIWAAEKKLKKKLLPARLLTWYPKAAFSSGILEALVAHKDKNLSARLLKLVRMQTSFVVSCPFCIDMNSFEYAQYGITDEELKALQGNFDPCTVPTFSREECTAVAYARAVSSTPIALNSLLVNRMLRLFSAREIVIIATTAAQVNYWARLVQALGIPPAGFLESCPLIDLEKYRTLKDPGQSISS